MTAVPAAAIVCGTVLGAGLWLLLVRLPFMRSVSFVERIEPQLRSQNLESRLLRAEEHVLTPFGPLERIIRPLIREATAKAAPSRPPSTRRVCLLTVNPPGA